MTRGSLEHILQDDEDFLVEIIDYNGQPAVKKTPAPTAQPERILRLQNEAHGLRFFTGLAAKHPDLNLYVPKLFESSEAILIREYIGGPPVGDDSSNLINLARLLAGIDRIEPYGEARISPNFDYRNIRERLDIWTERPLVQGLISQKQIDKSNKILDSLEQYVQPRIAHGDLSPYAHAFMMPDNKIAFIDYEVFTPNGARYYDVARCYTRLWSTAPSTAAPKNFLRSFLGFAQKVDHQEEQFMAIILQRTIGMQRDAAVDADKGENYIDRAAELLDLVLQEKLELLYQ
jgi:hypothetical protein